MATRTNGADGELKLFGPEMLADPYPTYHRLRASHAVSWNQPLDAWVVTGYDAVTAALRNPQLSSDHRWERVQQRLAGKGISVMLDESAHSMLHKDPPDHTRLRGLVNKAFTPRAVDALEGRIQSMIDGLLEAVQGRGRMDAIADLAGPLPMMVIAEMLGVPPEDRAQFKHWSNEISLVLNGDAGALSSDEVRRVLEARKETVAYFRTVVARKREGPQDDLLTALVRAEESGGRLSEDEVYSTAILLLIAGNETTTNLIGNGLLALLSHPEQLRTLLANPSLVSSGVEEMLRYDSPVQLTARLARTDQDVHGTTIRREQWVYLVLGAANRDPAQFPEPDRFDVSRGENKHIAFGAGPHFCLGAPLARLEARLVFRTLLNRFPGLRLGTEVPEYRNNFNLRGLKALQVVL